MGVNLDFYTASLDDLESIFKIIDITGWGETREDIERVMKNPSCSYISVVDRITGEMIGITLAVAFNDFGFIGHVIVNPDFRGMGIGEELMIEAINHLKFKGCKTIKLDAVDKAKSLYERVGFKFELNSLRYQYEIKNDDSITFLLESLKKYQSQFQTSKIEEQDLKQIYKIDKETFGVDRHNLLLLFYEDYPELSFITRDSKNEIIGYNFGQYQNGILKLRAGMSVSTNTLVQHLKEAIIAVKEKSDFKFIKFGILENNIESVKLLEKLGFIKTSYSLRMYWGKKSTISINSTLFAIGDPAKG
ncbi:MAG: GNAT family N-acetyltransferase [Asgard group archaeon]|nr:GNAT family N-acetyltransferase [Asgard group archaeon]